MEFNKIEDRTVKEYHLTIDMAKELCMVENNEMGKRIRRYFIEVEKRYREIYYNNITKIKKLLQNKMW